jgi:glutathionylspermidine amidase/synthetase
MKKILSSEKFGVVLGIAPGNVPSYSSDYETVDEAKLTDRHTYRNYVDGVFTGYKWQCVEFARRWLYINKGYIFTDVAMAYNIFHLKNFKLISDNTSLDAQSFENGATTKPAVGSLLIWDEGGEFEKTGHVAIITEVFDDKVRIVEQNESFEKWPEGRDYSRELHTKVDSNGGYWIECSYHDSNLLGWVTQTDKTNGASTPKKIDKKLFQLQKRKAKDLGQANKNWLNIANADEEAYVEAYGHEIKDKKGDPYQYFLMSKTAEEEVKFATNELHSMFMHATGHVLENENLLEKFCIPKKLWPKLKSSWDNRRNQMVTGRFDFALTENGLKVFEYNADSASCYMECGKIQKRWAKAFGVDEGKCSGEKLHGKLVEAWKDSDLGGQLHIMLDSNDEENYHALFMKSAIEEAGIDCKVIQGLTDLKWNDKGEVIDADGDQIKWVWKTWAWETALDLIRDESILKDSAHPPSLADTLLAKNVLVVEPFWTLLPSNKAILPVLCELYPDHPYLLNSSFELSKNLIKTGYVQKPIVGRCGANIKIFGANDSVVHETAGSFSERDQIYQELFPLQKIDGDNIQVQSFTVSGFYAGLGVRVDPSPIIVSGSDLPALRIVNDDAFDQ